MDGMIDYFLSSPIRMASVQFASGVFALLVAKRWADFQARLSGGGERARQVQLWAARSVGGIFTVVGLYRLASYALG